jgi:1-aminocyclopropane-1-carboxylate deaminase
MNPYIQQNPTPLQRLHCKKFDQAGITVWIKRDDLNHPQIQGNKWHKIKLNLQAAKTQGYPALLTFGGAYSNHIAATASAAQLMGFKSHAIIRGDELANNPTAWSGTLKLAHLQGMQFEFVSRQIYRLRHDGGWLAELQQRYPDCYLLPEGGTNSLAIHGFQSVIQELEMQCAGWTHLLCAVGTGGTLAGLVKHARLDQQVWGIASLAQADHLKPFIQSYLTQNTAQWQLFTDYHGGGYAKISEPIQIVMQNFEQQFSILLDPVYTAKLVFGFYDLLHKKVFAPGSQVILYHSGGLQGRS